MTLGLRQIPIPQKDPATIWKVLCRASALLGLNANCNRNEESLTNGKRTLELYYYLFGILSARLGAQRDKGMSSPRTWRYFSLVRGSL
jgi:hypothetical protein